MAEPVFYLDFREIELRVGDLWPDSDAPENPTVADVEALITKDGGRRSSLLSLWCLDSDLVTNMAVRRFPPEPR